MVGKSNLPSNAEQREDLCGATMTSGGLNALDQEREASMADEGGASGAFMEYQDQVSIEPVISKSRSASPWGWAAVLFAGVAGWALWNHRQDSTTQAPVELR